MARIRTLDQLQDALDKEMAWRVKEIGTFRVGSKTNGDQRKPLIRAGIALLYAHWEGFIKCASEMYLEFVESRGLKYNELKTCFSVFGLKGKLDTLSDAKKSEANIAAIDFIMAELGSTAKLQISSAIRTDSNLTSKVFKNIAKSLDISTGPYETKFNLIDTSLVDRRNKVAHGEFLEVGGQDFGKLIDEILHLMRTYKTDLENAASRQTFKRQAA